MRRPNKYSKSGESGKERDSISYLDSGRKGKIVDVRNILRSGEEETASLVESNQCQGRQSEGRTLKLTDTWERSGKLLRLEKEGNGNRRQVRIRRRNKTQRCK